MSEENKALVRQYYEHMNSHALEELGAFWQDPDFGAAVQRGCLRYFTAFPDFHASVEELIAEGDKVVCRTVSTGTHDGEYKGIEPTGRQMTMESVDIYRVKDGKFIGYWCLADVAGVTRQLTEEPVAAGTAG